MNRKIHLTNKTFVLTAVIGSFLILAMLTANTVWSSKQTGSATEEAVSAVSAFYLDAMADRRSKIITNMINNTFDEMEKALVFLEGENVSSQEELRDAIGKLKSLLSIQRFALVDVDDIVYTQHTTYTGRSRHDFLSQEKMEGRIISTVTLYDSTRQLCLAIPASGLSIMGKAFKACFVQMDINAIVDLLAFDDQDGTYFALYSANGGNISGTPLGPVISDRNILEATRGVAEENAWKKTCDNFAAGAGGSMTFASGQAQETLCYVPVQGTGWEMAVLIRDSVIRDQIRHISEKNLVTSRNQIIFAIVVVLLLAAVLLWELRMLAANRLEEEKKASRTFRDMANTDPMTGVQNRHAYYETEAVINQRLEETRHQQQEEDSPRQQEKNNPQKLAVVVCDINGLKYTNDTKGHAAGDRLIKDASAMICAYFPKESVFRVGGDEFALLLEGEAYDTMEEALRAFNRKIEANIKEDTVVIAAGYAVLESGDRRLHDVFDRADRMMYERKKQLKEMGAKTRRAE